MPLSALTSAEISLPSTADADRVQERIAVLADTVAVVGLTANHAGQSRMSPLAAVALAREQGVATVVHVSCRDRNRLALQSQIVGAAALESEGVLCLYGDPGADVNPFPADLGKELDLLRRKVDAGADFIQTQMVFDMDGFRRFLDQAAP